MGMHPGTSLCASEPPMTLQTSACFTRQIVDLPGQQTPIIGRHHVQPQCVSDCVNARLLLPGAEDFPGVQLPPPLSPFVFEKEGDYIPPPPPPSEVEDRALQRGEDPEDLKEEEEDEDDDNQGDGDVGGGE